MHLGNLYFSKLSFYIKWSGNRPYETRKKHTDILGYFNKIKIDSLNVWALFDDIKDSQRVTVKVIADKKKHKLSQTFKQDLL
jgi:hypothetical protein